MQNKTQLVLSHFKTSDPILFAAAQKFELQPLQRSDDLFESLSESIISQQLSVKVSDVLFARFKKLFPKEKISAKQLSLLPDETIRTHGISWAKIRALKDLARHVNENLLELHRIDDLSNENVTAELVRVKGIGPWTAEMFLMFSLAREDIFSTRDLGLKRAIQKIYGLTKEPDEKKLLSLSKKWSPYRTYACRILWKTLDNNPLQ
ncbi:MAG TPA: DNA-3-methyladenine glycosylase [Patescibacteria group bacterium]|nr:DNA-3-methyladenine glycosylase [Patescibacteria group bacterium]